MRHSIVSWDCTFRNFFHLIDALIAQDYPKDNYELIFVEQRTKSYADKYNHAIGLKSLGDRYEEVKKKINFKICYLNDSQKIPYHLGKCNNTGISEAKGEIISIMDGDLLLPNNFLKKLDEVHKTIENSIVNLHRFMCPHPLNVNFENWKDADVNFEECLKISNYNNEPLANWTGNKGPLISASRTLWDKINGYDPDIIWATSASTSGQDVTQRLEIVTGSKSIALTTSYCVHPWHPIGYAAKTRDIKKSFVETLLNAQKQITKDTIDKNIYNWSDRIETCITTRKSINKTLKKVIKKEIQNDIKNYYFTINKKTKMSNFKDIIRPYVPRVLKHLILKKLN